MVYGMAGMDDWVVKSTLEYGANNKASLDVLEGQNVGEMLSTGPSSSVSTSTGLPNPQ